MTCIVFSKKYYDTNCGGDVGILVASVDEVVFSLDLDHLLVNEDITRNIIFLGL